MIYPHEYPKTNKDFSNERVFFQRFKRELGREFTVYYSVKLATPDIPMREIDFLVVSPRMILCIELKNGKWRFRNSRWEFYNRRGKAWEESKNKPYKGPVDQVRSAKKILIDFIYHHNDFQNLIPLEYFQSSIFFLKNDPEDFPIPDSEKKCFVGKTKLKDRDSNLQDILREIQNQELPPLPGETLKKLHEILRLNLNFSFSINQKKKTQDQELVNLTKEQFEVLNQSDKESRIILLGVPGSGKTLVAGERAFRFESSGIRTLFISPDTYSLDRFQEYFSWFSVDFAEVDTRTKTPNLNSKSLNFQPPYDFLIFDSAEKYLSPDFLHSKKHLLKGGWEEGHWLVVGDWFQFLKNPGFKESIEILRFFETAEFIWKENIRTPKTVYQHACILGRKEYEPSHIPDITGVHYSKYVSEEDFFRRLDWSIGYGIRELGLKRDDIAVLSLIPEWVDEIWERKKNLQFPITRITEWIREDPEQEERTRPVLIASLADFGGREIRYMVLVGIKDFNDPKNFDLFYQALTRCTGACTILFPEAIQDQLAELYSEKKWKGSLYL